MKKRLCKLISIISALALLVSALSVGSIVNAADTGDAEFQAIAETVEVSNETTAETLLAALQEAGADVVSVTDFYKLSAFEGAVEKGSTYEGAVDGEILVPGIDGYVSAVVTLGDGSTDNILLTIEPTMVEYSFESASNTMDDWAWSSSNNRYEYKPVSGTAAEKVVIPDEITELKSDWNQYWNYNVKDTVRCVVFNENITAIPGVTGGSCWNVLEVVSIKGNSLKSFDSYTSSGGTTYGAFYNAYNLKHIQIPESLTNIGDYTFYKCSSLEMLYLPDGLATIGGKVFFAGYNSHSGQGHNLKELTIPASVTTIGQTAFAGSLSDFTVTALTSAPYNSAEINTSGINGRAFCTWSDNHKFNCNTTVRALTGSGAASPYFNERETESKFKALYMLEDVMGVAEAVARAARKAEKMVDDTYISDAGVLSEIRSSFVVSTISLSLKGDWTVNGNNMGNTLVFSKDGAYAELPITMLKKESYDLQSVADSANITVDNATTEETLLAAMQDITMPEGYTLGDMTDFYKLSAIEGAVEKGSTYAGAVDGEILVSGVDGYVSAVFTVNGPDDKTYLSTVVFEITAPMAEYSFASVSDTTADPNVNIDWAWDDYNEKWSYTPASGTAAEKLVIPEGITELKSDWNQYWNYNVKDTVRCVVFNENITAIPGVTGGSCWNALEVVSIKGNSLKSFDSYTSSGGTTYGAFYNAYNLKHIQIPESLTSIGDYTFYKCSSLKMLYLPEGLTTIGGKVFFAGYNSHEGQGHNLQELTIPASVTTIGQTAFAGSLSDFTVTALTSAPYNSAEINTSGINGRAFCTWSDNHKFNCNTTVRAFEGSGAASPFFNERETESKFKAIELLDDVMGLAEATARTARMANILSATVFTDSDTVVNKLKASYGNLSGVSIALKDTVWSLNDGRQENVAILTMGESTATVKLSLEGKTSFYQDGAAILTTEAFTANGNKQGIRFYNAFESTSADKVLVKGAEYDIVEFGVLIKSVGTDDATVMGNKVSDSEFVLSADGAAPAGVTKITGKENTMQTANGENFYTVYVKNIPQGGRDYSFQCRGYIKYTDENGESKVVYTDSQIRSVQDVFDIHSTADAYAGMADWFAGVTE